MPTALSKKRQKEVALDGGKKKDKKDKKSKKDKKVKKKDKKRLRTGE